MNHSETSCGSSGSSCGDDPLVEKQALKRKGGPGRKPEASEPATKRIAQVRMNAKAYRERKQKYVADLEATVASLSKGTEEADVLRARVAQLEAENNNLRQMQFGFFDVSPVQAGLPSDPMGELFMSQQNQQLPLQFDTFLGTHSDLDLDFLLGNTPTGLETLLKTPLPVAPSSDDVIQPLFSGIKSKLKVIPSLVVRPESSGKVDALVQWYIRYTDFQTREDNPVQCRITLGKIKRSQDEILGVCNDTVDRFFVEKMFGTIKKEYSIKTDKPITDPFLFLKHLVNVPSLANEKESIDRLCALYEAFTLHKDQRLSLDPQIRAIHQDLLSKCKTQSDMDEAKFTFDCLEDIFYV
ncbi:UNVERIFIED_CONTAM: hypothetical protein HDU68_009399 [Siphonaria sp. JEL0065]|nr:hypothetical protein HDU68_009399 [Siphonaria sp. JEL0065]